MSYILEALRKSEGERDTGHVPDLTSRHDYPVDGLGEDEAGAARPLWPWVLSAVLLANAGLLGYVFWPRASVSPAVAGPAPSAEPKSAAPQRAEPAPAGVPAAAAVPAQAQAVSLPQLQAMAPAPAASAQPAYPQGYAPPAYVQPAYPPAGYAQPAYGQPGYAQPAQAYVPPPGYGVPPQGYGQAALAYGQAAPNPAYAQPQLPGQAYGATPAYGVAVQAGAAEPLPELADGETLVTPEGVQAEDAGSVPDLSRMPPELQQAVPPMSLSTHVYSSNPAKSFVVINGQSYGVGAMVFPGLSLEAIVEDAVVFNRQGQRFKLDAMSRWPQG